MLNRQRQRIVWYVIKLFYTDWTLTGQRNTHGISIWKHTFQNCCWHIPGKTVESRQDAVGPCWQQWLRPRGHRIACRNISSAMLAYHQPSHPAPDDNTCIVISYTMTAEDKQRRTNIRYTHMIRYNQRQKHLNIAVRTTDLSSQK